MSVLSVFVHLTMGAKNMSEAEKGKVLAWRQENVPMSEIARRLGRGIATIKRLCARARGMPPSHIPQRKPQSGRPRKTFRKTNALLRREVSRNPSLTAGALKRAHPTLLQGVSE